jgi:hypothetical protein
LDVVIINPRSIRPDGTVDPDDRDCVIFKPAGRKCPHLAYREEKAICTIHHLLCYEGTPCDQFEQFGPEDAVCMLGSYFKSIGSQM